jgi:hypothetical protein
VDDGGPGFGQVKSNGRQQSAEASPGVVAFFREWVCEQRPDKPWPHDDCGGPGKPPARSVGDDDEDRDGITPV